MKGGRGSGTALDRADIIAAYNVSRETSAKLDILVEELRRWQTVKNLVGPGTLPLVWSRHVADSLQLVTVAPDALRWLDLGSGAGFPGLVVAAALTGRSGAEVHLVESNARKCAFLRHVVRVAKMPAFVREARLEEVVAEFRGSTEIVTARALAPLTDLIRWTEGLLKTGAVGVFPKGREAERELTEAEQSWRIEADLIPSRTDPDGRIVRIRSIEEQE